MSGVEDDHCWSLLGSDVQPCVWAIVESCVAIFCACLPTFPALFHMKSVRENQRPSSDPKTISSLVQINRPSVYRNNAADSHREFLGMTDWGDGTPTDRDSAVSHVVGETESVWFVLRKYNIDCGASSMKIRLQGILQGLFESDTRKSNGNSG